MDGIAHDIKPIVGEAMTNEHLHAPFLTGLNDIYDAENQLTLALPQLISAATSKPLKEALSKHFAETLVHVQRLENIFKNIGVLSSRETCRAMKGLVEECSAATKIEELRSRDAAIIATAQKVEHYEIATYGTLRAWAQAMQHDEATDLLEATLDEEKAANDKLTEISAQISLTSAE